MITEPLFQANLLNLSPVPFFFTFRGPNSTAAPYPMEEHPGPEKRKKMMMEADRWKHYIYDY